MIYKMSASVWAPSRRRRFARRKPKRCCAANRSTPRWSKKPRRWRHRESSPISDQRSSAENRRWIVEALTRRGLRTNLESRNRQGGSIMSLTINTTINGKSVSGSAEASTSLLEFLRDTLEFKGTKLCCNTGECGACTIIYNGKPINSCVTMAADAIGARDHHHRRFGRRRQAASGAASLHRHRRGAVRLLHAGLHHLGESAARPHHQTDGGRHRRSGLRQHLPLHRLQQDRRRDPSRRRQNRREGLEPWQKLNSKYIGTSPARHGRRRARHRQGRLRHRPDAQRPIARRRFCAANTPTRKSSASTPAKRKKFPAFTPW